MTMNLIQLQAVPNQEHSCLLGGRLFKITVQLGPSNSTLLSVDVDGNNIISGQLTPANTSVIPAPQNARFGNLAFDCPEGVSYPDYTLFGATHNLFWWDK